MNIIVDGEKIIEYMRIMYNNLEEYKNQIIVLQDLKKNIIWESESSKKALLLYDEEINNLIVFGNKVLTLVKFLSKFINNYDESLTEIKGNFKKLNDEFNILDK